MIYLASSTINYQQSSIRRARLTCLALGGGGGGCSGGGGGEGLCERRHVVDGEHAGEAVELALPPVAVLLLQHVDDARLGERQLVVVLRRVVVQRNHLLHCNV